MASSSKTALSPSRQLRKSSQRHWAAGGVVGGGGRNKHDFHKVLKKLWGRAWNFYSKRPVEPIDDFNRVGGLVAYTAAMSYIVEKHLGFKDVMKGIKGVGKVVDDLQAFVPRVCSVVEENTNADQGQRISLADIVALPSQMEKLINKMTNIQLTLSYKDGKRVQRKKNDDGEGFGEKQ